MKLRFKFHGNTRAPLFMLLLVFLLPTKSNAQCLSGHFVVVPKVSSSNDEFVEPESSHEFVEPDDGPSDSPKPASNGFAAYAAELDAGPPTEEILLQSAIRNRKQGNMTDRDFEKLVYAVTNSFLAKLRDSSLSGVCGTTLVNGAVGYNLFKEGDDKQIRERGKELVKHAIHEAIDRYIPSDRDIAKNVVDDVIDGASMVKGFLDASRPSRTAGPDKDPGLFERSVVPHNMKGVGRQNLSDGPSISAPPPAPQMPEVDREHGHGPNGGPHEGHGDWAGPDSKGGAVEKAGRIA